MTIEEKAKAYDDAKARMSRAWNDNRCTIGFMNEIFPEFKESDDDEKIRKEIILVFKHANHKGIYNKHLAWLEKQGEQKETLCDTCRKTQPSHSCQDITALGRCAMEKQDEQKPVEWSEDDEQYLLVCKNALEKYEVSDKCDSAIIMQWLKEKLKRPVKPNFRERYDRIKNSEWFKKTHEGMSVSEEPDDSYCQEHCKGFQETGKCFADSACSAKIEAESIDKAEPKFKVGDWITDGQLTCKVLGITGKFYELHLHNDDYCHFETDVQSVDKHYHLWSIQDAKKGDVLEFGDHGRLVTGIVSHINKTTGKVDVSCLLEGDKFKVGVFYNLDTIKPHPATKEQRDILFAKMKEARYEWLEETKELNKFHVIDEGKEEMDYCFTKMMNGEKVSSAWDEEDEHTLQGIIDEIQANKNQAPDYDFETYDRFLFWLKTIKHRIGG